MVLKLSEKVHFCNFVLAAAINLSLLKQLTYMVLKFFEKVHFCNFVLTSAMNLSLLKQFTYMVLNFLKKCIFAILCADVSKKSKSIKVIYIYASEMSPHALSKYGIVYCAMSYYLEILVFEVEKFC